MDPIEINAGRYYLRALRADRLIDDRPALAEAFADAAIRHALPGPGDPGEYVAARAAQWQDESACSWAVAEPTTGLLLGEVGLLLRTDAVAYCWTLPAHRREGVAATALSAVLRFGEGALDLEIIRFRHRADEVAPARLAAACGLVRAGAGAVADGADAVTEWRKEAQMNSA